MPKSDLRIVGGEYAPVADRIALFHEKYSDGRIVTELISQSDREIVFKASVFRSPSEALPAATGWASERFDDGEINRVACLENTETSAIGRALANLGFLASKSRPSLEEMQKADRSRQRLAAAASRSSGREPLKKGPSLVAEGSRVNGDLQARADMTTDVLRLLEIAGRAGAGHDRIASLRRRVLAASGSPVYLDRLERRLRRWLERQRRRAPA